jgi:hypothetical protein
MEANKNILGHNDQQQVSSFRSFIIPSGQELLLYVTISFVAILLSSLTTIWQVLTDFSQLESITLTEAFMYQDMLVNPYILFSYLGDFTVFFIWGLIGCVSYVLVWGIQHMYARVREDQEESSFVHSGQKYWVSRGMQHGFFIAVIIIFMTSVVAAPSVISIMNALARITLLSLDNILQYVYIFAAIGLGVVYLYVFTRIWRVFRYSISLYFLGSED